MDQTGTVTPVSWANFSDEVIAGFQQHAHLDPWTLATPQMAPCAGVRLTELVPTAEYQRSAFYNDFLRQVGDDTSYCLAALFPVGDSVGALSFHRGDRQGDFQVEQQSALTEAMPALVTLLQARSRLDVAERKAPLLEATVNAWPRAILHVDQKRRIVFANQAGEGVLQTGEVLRDAQGRVGGAGRHAPEIDAALNAALVAGRGAGLALDLDEGRQVVLTIAPLYSGRLGSTLALISIDGSETLDSDLAAAYMAYFQLTRAEAAIAVGLANGKSLEEISAERSTQIGTARTQLRTILRKTGARRQAQLVAMLRGLPNLPFG